MGRAEAVRAMVATVMMVEKRIVSVAANNMVLME